MYKQEKEIESYAIRNSIKQELDILNDQRIIFRGKLIDIEIRGYLSSDLSKMKVSLFIYNHSQQIKIRYRLDLYNFQALSKLVHTISEQEQLDKNYLLNDFLKLTKLLEKHRDKQFNNEQKDFFQRKKILPVQEQKAITTLKRKDLLKYIDQKLEQTGIIGEQKNRLSLFLIAMSYKMPHQLHAIIEGESGSGKTHLINKIADCMPSEDVKRYTRISEKALQNMEENELVNKCVVFQDLGGLGPDAQFALRELQSSGIFESSVTRKDIYGNPKTLTKVVKAKMSSMSATTKNNICYDNLTRSIVFGIDQSEEQTQKIINYQNKLLAGLINKDNEDKAKQDIRNLVRVLKSFYVVNPYAHLLKLSIKTKMRRRLNIQFHQFVAQITLLHQYQRKQDKQKRLIVEKSDILQAIDLFLYPILLKTDDLDNSSRQLFEQIKKYILKSKKKKKEFNQYEIRKQLNKSKSTINEYLKRLLDAGYIKIISGSKNKGYNYIIAIWDNINKCEKQLKEQLLNFTEH